MTRLLNFLWNRALLFVSLVAIAAFLAVAGPHLPQWQQSFEEDVLNPADIAQDGKGLLAIRQRELNTRTLEAKTLSTQLIQQRIAARQTALAAARQRQQAASVGLFAAYRPSQIAARTTAEIEIAAIESELKALGAALAPRRNFDAARQYLAANPAMPTAGAIVAANRLCAAAGDQLNAFKARPTIEQGLRETFQLQRTEFEAAVADRCNTAQALAARRMTALAARKNLTDAQTALAALQAEPLPQSLIPDAGRVTLRDILVQALFWLVLITGMPPIYRAIAYFVLAPIAARWPPMRFAPVGTAPPQPVATPSAISVAITLGTHEEALVRQDYLQSSSLTGAKRTRWLLDWGHPFTSFASGMRFLTAISGNGERVTVSAVKDPFAELAILSVPAGAACVLRPSALAAVVQSQGVPLMIRAKWRLFSLPAWLTWQWRFLVFHGPARLVVKGGRGVRIEPAARGRIVGEGQVLGFSTDLAYAVIRSETFWPYFFGREALLKDKVEAGSGVLLIEEAPLTGRSGIRRGVAGITDALLKVGGI